MDVIFGPMIKVAVMAIDIYIWMVVIQVILSWLVSFNVINTSNRLVYGVGDFLHRLTEPALSRVRRFVPNIGNFDISPIVLILGLILIEDLLIRVGMKIGT